MELEIFTRLACEASVYALITGFISLILGGRGIPFSLCLFVPVASTLSYLISNKKKTLAVLPSALVLISIIGFKNEADIAFVVLSFVYVVYISISGKYSTKYSGFRKIMLYGLVSFVLVASAATFMKLPNENFPMDTVRLFGVYAVSGIICLQFLQHNKSVSTESEFKYANLKIMGLLAVVMLFLTWDLPYKLIVSLISIILNFLFGLLRYLGLEIGNIEFTDLGLEAHEDMKRSNEVGGKQSEDEPFDVNLPGNTTVMIIVGVIIAGAILFFLIRMFSNNKAVEKTKLNKINREHIKNDEKNKSDDRLVGNRGEVRKYYKKFLELCKKRNIRLEPFDTSLDVEDKSISEFEENALRQMRKVYISARYDDEDVTSADAKSAKEIYNELNKRLKVNKKV